MTEVETNGQTMLLLHCFLTSPGSGILDRTKSFYPNVDGYRSTVCCGT